MIKILTDKLSSGIKDKDNQELVKGGASAIIMRTLAVGVSYLFTFLIAWSFGASGSGIYAIFQSALQFFVTVSMFGFDTLLMRSVAQYSALDKWGKIRDLYFKAMWLTNLTAIFFSVTLFIYAEEAATFVFLKPALSPYLKISALCILPLVILNIHADCLRGMKKIMLFSFLQSVSVLSIACVVLSVTMFFYKQDDSPLIAYGCGLFITAIVSARWWWVKSSVGKAVSNDPVNLTENISVAFTLFSMAMLQVFRGWTDTLLLARFSTEEAVGIYKVAFRISTITSLTLTSILLTAAPKIAELYAKGDLKKMGTVTQNATKIIFWTSVPVLILFILFPSFFLGIFGEEFETGATVLVILSLGQFINAASGPVGNVLNMTGKQRINRNVQFISTVITILLNIIFIPVYGIMAAAVVSLVGYALVNLIPMFIVRYNYGFYTIDIKSLFSFKLASQKTES